MEFMSELVDKLGNESKQFGLMDKVPFLLRRGEGAAWFGSTFHSFHGNQSQQFRLKICKTNQYCLKLENMKSKYTAANYRSPILNVWPLFAELFPQHVSLQSVTDPQLQWWKQEEEFKVN